MSFAGQIALCPRPFDAELGREAAADFAGHGPDVAEFLAGVAGCSPFLAATMARHRAWLDEALALGPDAALARETDALASAAGEGGLPARLRRARGRIALLVALADIGGLWPLGRVTGALTDFADLAVGQALAAGVEAELAAGRLPETGRPDGALAALAMGKMGAGELNFSSDIDLVCLYDGDAYPDGGLPARMALARAVRRMAAILGEVTADGFVFRTDLRLRPDAAVTPVALGMAAAESYYESVGRTWERAAYIKARAAAGDLEGGQAFLERLRPFVWRRHLDYAAIQDAHDMRLRIRSHKRLDGPFALPGHDMKLGRGGIREIEFFTQTRQLIVGGRDPDLRCRGTVEGLAVLAAKGWVDADAAAVLTRAYEHHRKVEHRLQMIADAQTHELPADEAGFARLAAFMGLPAAELERGLRERLEEVHALTEGFFAPGKAAAALPDMPDGARDAVERWYGYPALRSPRAVEIFERLKPDLVARLTRAARPGEAIAQFDRFLSGLPAGVQLFSLFEANPHLVDLIADICSVSPALARHLGRNSQVLDAVIGGSFFEPWPGRDALADDLASRLAAEPDYEGVLDSARRWHKEQHFRIGVHFLRGLAAADEAGAAYADLAEATLRALWAPAVREFARKHGEPPGRGAALAGAGRLGAGRLLATSELDLIVVYDAEESDLSDGPRPLDARQYYARLAQAAVTALAARTAEGALYAANTRPRPSGRSGPVATSLRSFRAFHREEASVGELFALTRLRPVAGDGSVGAAVEGARAEALALARDPGQVAGELRAARARLAGFVRPGDSWDAARGAGGTGDIELFGQAAALLAGDPARDPRAQVAAAARLGWLTAERAAELAGLHRALWPLEAAAGLLGEDPGEFGRLGEGARAFVLGQAGAATRAAMAGDLESRCAAAADIVARALERPVPAS